MDDKVYTPEVISDTPFPGQTGSASLVVGNQSTPITQIHNPSTIQQQAFPIKQIAHELLSVALNTRSKKILQEFNFSPSGAIQIGDYTQGISGDIRISPGGIVARDSLGDITFALDGETGDATFKGTIQTGSVITGALFSGDIQLGGAGNEFGTLEIFNQFGTIAVQSTKDFFTVNDTSGNPFFKVDFINEILYTSGIIVGGTIGTPSAGAFIGSIEMKMDDDTGTVFIDADSGISLTNDRPITFYMTSGGAPSTPIANSASIYLDTSGGKNKLMILFHTGSPVVIASEP